MPGEIEIEYNTSLQPLEDLLPKISRPGDFFMEGSKEVPMPTITINGVGALSFPVLEVQAKAMIQEACLAPYGRGEETILNTSVRKTWQISPNRIQINGKSWQMNFEAILDEVKTALGCHDVIVSAELYKLLIYGKDGFFLPHRDSEKSHGMFATMIITLPSLHEGGELIVCHKDSKAVIDLSGAEGSELKFGAFYADCKHEVLPVTKGYRICLVYNLIQKFLDTNQKKKATSNALTAPCYTNEIQKVSNILENALNENNQSSKLVWLLEHQYSKVELSFNSLKNADAAIAKVLIKAARQAKYAIHLGIVHIEESGGAEADFGYYSSRSRRGYYDTEMDVESDDYEIMDICDAEHYIDGWMNPQNRLMDFGKIPIEAGELLPSHALDGVEPDEQRLLEATGNAGVSFERAYHRAALILWSQKNYIEVLLQSGIKSGINYFKEQMNLGTEKKNQSQRQVDMKNIALAIIGEFEESIQSTYPAKNQGSTSAEMLALLCQLQENALIERFLRVVNASYDGSENDSLVAVVDVLQDPSLLDHLFSDLFQKNMSHNPVQCINLYKTLTSVFCKKFADTTKLKHSSQVIINKLKSLNKRDRDEQFSWNWRKRTRIGAESVVLLWDALTESNAKKLQNEVVSIFIAYRDIFDPRTILVPALAKLQSSITLDSPLLHLWKHASNSLLEKSEYPPNPPKNWAQEAEISCSCADCKDLKVFAQDPNIQIYRFQMAQQRRDHIVDQLQQNRLDMSTETEKSRRPYTLVCTKTRQRYQEKCNEYQADIKAMQLLIPLTPDLSKSEEENKMMKLRGRLMEAVKIQSCNLMSGF